MVYFWLSLGDTVYKNVRRTYNLGLNWTDYVNILKVSWRYKSQMSTCWKVCYEQNLLLPNPNMLIIRRHLVYKFMIRNIQMNVEYSMSERYVTVSHNLLDDLRCRYWISMCDWNRLWLLSTITGIIDKRYVCVYVVYFKNKFKELRVQEEEKRF